MLDTIPFLSGSQGVRLVAVLRCPPRNRPRVEMYYEGIAIAKKLGYGFHLASRFPCCS